MPLIMMCGIPSSGKTTKAKELYEYLKEKNQKAVLINEESLLIKRSEGYQDSKHEKMTRGALKAEVERNISKNVVVIADSLNYIKGFRYELFCLARAATTTHCVIYCNTPLETAIEWNSKREDEQWDEKLLKEIVYRFEEPNDRRKWDDPCYVVQPGDQLPLEDIYNFVCQAKFSSKPNQATVYSKIADTNYLYDLEKITQEVITTIHTSLNESFTGNVISIPNCKNKVKVIREITLAELRRLRRQFIKLTKQMETTNSSHTDKSQSEILDAFVDYINTEIENSDI